MSYPIQIGYYSDKSIVVKGEGTNFFKTYLVNQCNGSWNPGLVNGAGYIFSREKSEACLQNFVNLINAGQLAPTDSVDLTKLEKSTKFKSITYKIYQPHLEEMVSLKLGETTYLYKVVFLKVDNNHNIIDNVYINKLDDNSNSLLQIINGKWQMRGIMEEHQVSFADELSTTSPKILSFQSAGTVGIGNTGTLTPPPTFYIVPLEGYVSQLKSV